MAVPSLRFGDSARLGYNDDGIYVNPMITPEQEDSILSRAYVPEHLVGLMVAISKGTPFLMEDHVGYDKDDWLIFVGYPLDRSFSLERCERVVGKLIEASRHERFWYIGPQVPAILLKSCAERESDEYYTLDLDKVTVSGSLRGAAEKAGRVLAVERTRTFRKEDEELASELLEREPLPPRVRELYRAMPRYVAESPSAWVLNGWDEKGRLSAFYVVDLEAKHFVTYVVGAHSKKHYVPHASDRLFLEMIRLAQESGKNTIHLGLGVNQGIRRFKRKWGGIPFLRYEFCEFAGGGGGTISLVRALLNRL